MITKLGLFEYWRICVSLGNAKKALREWGEGEEDNYLHPGDFVRMIAEELETQGIKPNTQRIMAVASWAEQCVKDNGIHVGTAVEESVECSLYELQNEYK